MRKEEQKCCKYCDHRIAGRSDKVFCNDQCRNAYHNEKQQGLNQQMRPVLSSLKRNRKILWDAFTGSKGGAMAFQDLLALGYTNRYCTEHRQYNGADYYFSFDIGYKVNENFQITILTRAQFESISKPMPSTTLELLKGSLDPDQGNHLRKNR